MITDAEKVKELFDLSDKLEREAKSLRDTIGDCLRKGVPAERIDKHLSEASLYRAK